MNIELNFTEEQSDALAIKTAQFNESIRASLTPEQYLVEEVLAKSIAQMTKEAYDAAVQRLGVTASGLPYAERKALIQQVENAVHQNSP